MPSPFPGMDPYLEGYLWTDFHQDFASAIRRYIAPQIQPQYVARLAVRMVQDPNPEAEVGIMYPDVEVLRHDQAKPQQPLPKTGLGATVAEVVSPSLTVPLIDYQVRLVNIEVLDSATNKLVTNIEILSPINKRGRYLREYRRKRTRLEAAGVHILEIDLLRRGRRPVLTSHVAHSKELREAQYLVTLLRSEASSLQAWPLKVTDPLPVVAVPLRAPDADATLHLGECFSTVYNEAYYALSLPYTEAPPPPSFDDKTTQWIDNLLRDYRTSATDG